MDIAVLDHRLSEPEFVSRRPPVARIFLGKFHAVAGDDQVKAPHLTASMGRNWDGMFPGYVQYPPSRCYSAAPGDVRLPQVQRSRLCDSGETVVGELVLSARYQRRLHQLAQGGLAGQVVGCQNVFEPVDVELGETFAHL